MGDLTLMLIENACLTRLISLLVLLEYLGQDIAGRY